VAVPDGVQQGCVACSIHSIQLQPLHHPITSHSNEAGLPLVEHC